MAGNLQDYLDDLTKTGGKEVKVTGGNPPTYVVNRMVLFNFLRERCQINKDWTERFLEGLPQQNPFGVVIDDEMKVKVKFDSGGYVLDAKRAETVNHVLSAANAGKILPLEHEGEVVAYVYDFSGDNRKHGKYEFCTESFARKHIWTDEDDNAVKSGKRRKAEKQPITRQTLIRATAIYHLQHEVNQRQKEYHAAYVEDAKEAWKQKRLAQAVFETEQNHPMVTYDFTTETLTESNSHFMYSVVPINGKYLINHFAGVCTERTKK